jgi:hypothetical protein
VAARLKPLFEEEARQRQVATQRRGNEVPVVLNLIPPEKHGGKGKSAHKAAELMKVWADDQAGGADDQPPSDCQDCYQVLIK